MKKIKNILVESIIAIIEIICNFFNWLKNNNTPILKISWLDFLMCGLSIILFIFSLIVLFISFLKLFIFSFNFWMNW